MSKVCDYCKGTGVHTDYNNGYPDTIECPDCKGTGKVKEKEDAKTDFDCGVDET